MHGAQDHIIMSTQTNSKTNNDKASNPFILRINLKKLLTEEEAKSFQEQAEKNGRTIREHFLALTLGDSKQPAA
jgi:hypothetical protein